MRLKKNIKQTSALHTIVCVLMTLFILFLPLSSWSSDIIFPSDKSSENIIVLDTTDSRNNTMPCHSKDTEMARSNQETYNNDCCDQSRLYTECDNCEHNCTFVKHFSNTIDSINISGSSTQLALKPVDHITTQFPVPPFRPPAA